MKISRWMAAALVVAAMGAQAQGMQMPKDMPWSVEFAVVPLTASDSSGSGEATAGRFLLSYKVSPFIELEAMAAVGLERMPAAGSTELSLKQSLGLFLKPGMDLGPGLRGFLRLGSISSTIESKDSSGSNGTRSKSTTAYGAGIAYRVADQWSLAIDYMRYAHVEGVTVQGPSIGLAYSF